MKVEFETVASPEQEGASIRAVERTAEVQAAIGLLEHGMGQLPVLKDDKTFFCQMDRIYYVESVDKKTFVYTKDDCFQTKKRLYELEEELTGNFMRCAKAMIVNIRKIREVKSDYHGRMNARLLNGETIVISRSYVKDLKKRLGL